MPIILYAIFVYWMSDNGGITRKFNMILINIRNNVCRKPKTLEHGCGRFSLYGLK